VHCRPPNMNPTKPDCLSDEKVHTSRTHTTHNLTLLLLMLLWSLPSRCASIPLLVQEGKRLLKETYKRLFHFFGTALDLL
jgi:hypothetical protein